MVYSTLDDSINNKNNIPKLKRSNVRGKMAKLPSIKELKKEIMRINNKYHKLLTT
jgi:hypothetical protein